MVQFLDICYSIDSFNIFIEQTRNFTALRKFDILSWNVDINNKHCCSPPRELENPKDWLIIDTTNTGTLNLN